MLWISPILFRCLNTLLTFVQYVMSCVTNEAWCTTVFQNRGKQHLVYDKLKHNRPIKTGKQVQLKSVLRVFYILWVNQQHFILEKKLLNPLPRWLNIFDWTETIQAKSKYNESVWLDIGNGSWSLGSKGLSPAVLGTVPKKKLWRVDQIDPLLPDTEWSSASVSGRWWHCSPAVEK